MQGCMFWGVRLALVGCEHLNYNRTPIRLQMENLFSCLWNAITPCIDLAVWQCHSRPLVDAWQLSIISIAQDDAQLDAPLCRFSALISSCYSLSLPIQCTYFQSTHGRPSARLTLCPGIVDVVDTRPAVSKASCPHSI